MLQQAMMFALVLAMPNFDKLFILEVDASGYGVGAVLFQEGHPITFYRKVLGQQARLKSIYEKD